MAPNSTGSASSSQPGPLPGLRPRVLEAFVVANFAFLVLDIYLAHSVNAFHHFAEWIPLWFSALAAVSLVPGLLAPRSGYAHWSGLVFGFGSIALGVAGTLLHLDSQFFELMTVQGLVYTAPFAAPLAYCGLGFLLLLNRLLPHGTVEWSRWVVFFALGGFAGNFALSLCDHAQNGFFHWSEWIPVGASALAIGFLSVALQVSDTVTLRWTQVVLALQVLTGLVGFVLHLRADVSGLSASLAENFIHGAPIFAPLLFANIALLGAFGVWGLGPRESAS